MHVFWPDNKCRPGEVEEGWDVVESTDSCVFAPCEPRLAFGLQCDAELT